MMPQLQPVADDLAAAAAVGAVTRDPIAAAPWRNGNGTPPPPMPRRLDGGVPGPPQWTPSEEAARDAKAVGAAAAAAVEKLREELGAGSCSSSIPYSPSS